MTVMPLPWWAEIDRAKLLTFCRQVFEEHGILAVPGDGLSGRSQAAQLVERELERLGCTVISFKKRGQRANDARSILTELAVSAEKLQPSFPGTISTAITGSSASEAGLFQTAADELGRLRASGGNELGIVLADFEEDDPPRPSLQTIRHLADRVGGAWIVIGSNSVEWNMLQPIYRHELNKFRRDHVARVLRLATRNSIVAVDTADALLEELFATYNTRVTAAEAYTALKYAEVTI
jgi:hypothetical protein